LRTERNLDGVGEDVDAAEHLLTRVGGKTYVFRCHVCLPYLENCGRRRSQAITPRMSLSFMISSSSPSILTSVPDHLPNRILSPASPSSGTSLPASSRAPEPTATTSPSWGFSLAVSGMMMPPLVFSSAVRRRTTTRSCSG